jgi:gas vesicle protein
MKICSFMAFVGGVVAGGVAALMLAPKKGEEFRKEIKERMDGVKRHFNEATGCCNAHGCTVNEDANITEEE